MLGPLALLVLLRTVPALDVVYEDATFHLVFVTAIAGSALAVAVVAALAGARSAHYGPVWLAVGCLWVGAAMVAHGLTTPGVGGQPLNAWVSRLAQLAILGFAVTLRLASAPRNRATSRLAAQHPKALLGTAGSTTTLAAALIIADPTILHGYAPFSIEKTLHWIAAGASIALLVPVAVVHWRRWRLGHDPVQFSLLLAAAMSAAATMSLRFGELWRLSWWDYHGFLLAGFAGAVYAVVLRRRRTSAVDAVLAATFERDPMTHIVDGYPEALRSLVRAVEEKDHYTHGHSQRTAAVAVQLGLHLRLDEDTLRALARGAYLHDVGKVAIPDHILNKPGRLDAEERAIVETHPQVGNDIVAATNELDEALPVVLHHHERWDGTGYPSRMAGPHIPLIARIAAVADVWDALTSDRSYRAGLEPTAALAHIVAGRGRHFDPRAVDAMVALAADWGYRVDGTGDGDAAWSAAEDCHAVTANRS